MQIVFQEGDEIGELLSAEPVVVLIGERPGLLSADSLGAWRPRIGTMDSNRNCISNIRPAGLSTEEAATQIADVIDQAFEHAVTGVRLNTRATASPSLSSRHSLIAPQSVVRRNP